MTNREALKLAAFAARYWLDSHTQKSWAFTYGGCEWDPRTSDRDAFRLAVDARIDVDHANDCAVASFDVGRGGPFIVPHGDDPCAATRQAIFLAAVEIGRQMP